MIKETVSTFWHLRRSRSRYPAPRDQIDQDGYIKRTIQMPSGLRDYLHAVYDEQEQYGAQRVARVAGAGMFAGGIALVAASHDLRFYLFPQQGPQVAHELPAREPVGEDTNLTNVTILQRPRVWSLTQMIEAEQGISAASAISYGLDIVRTIHASPGMNLRLIDPGGRSAKATFDNVPPIPPPLDLTQ
jgi:hypothetical protein